MQSKTLFFALLAAVQKVSVVAFVPPKATKIVLPSAAITTSRSFEPNAVINPRGSTALSGLLTPLADAPISTEGLTFGWVVICAAMTPYVIQLVAPQPLGFFLANYYGGQDIAELKQDGYTNEQIEDLVESGRVAEVKWKVRFAALCLAVTTIAFFEVNDGVDAVRVLRDSYIAWGIFYVEATRLIREQALEEPSILKIESRFGIQLWHVLVTILLWASISETYTGNAVRTFVTDIFTF
ncbi:hypothetical protein QTG54_013547 [Skeletonema marinoi]|uniref:Uncharacterized protein n=1 Tax=Skeletonema marinoi TaxID=267567 RepID=A0AAD8XYX6_9STRA|nr:hypothetical protein QTG54_013547 [Skeletonema marinoi]